MQMGLLDLPAPAFDGLETLFAEILPQSARLVVWALIAAVVSMELYRLLSPQSRIEKVRHNLRHAQRQLARYDGDFEGARTLIGRLLGSSLLRLGLVAPPAIVASLPALCLLVWLDLHYGHRFPIAGETVAPWTDKADFEARWMAGNAPAPNHLVVMARDGSHILDMPVSVPVGAVSKWHWWNTFVGNPVGYLPPDAPIEEVNLDLPTQNVVSIGPSWLRTWELPFFSVLLIGALLLKSLRRIT